jgi:hypothetical protein
MVQSTRKLNHTTQEVTTVFLTPFPYNLSDTSLTFYVDGKPTQVLRDHPSFNEIVMMVEAGDPAAVELAKPAAKIVAALNETTNDEGAAKWFRRAAGKIVVTEWGVTFNGSSLHGHVVDRLMDVLKAGLNTAPWVSFVGKLQQNPSSTSRDELYLWLEKSGMPITPDGDFLAYKRVRANYKDIHSGKFDNSVGNVVEMSRLDVDDDRRKTCSAGLHFCSKDYLPYFSGNGGSDHVMVVKINPADVVSIPADYNDAKGRTWRYEVVGEISLEDAGLRWGAISYDYGDDEMADDDYWWDGADDGLPDDSPADREVIGQVFAAYNFRFGVSDSKEGPEREVRLMRARYALGVAPSALPSFNSLTVSEAQALFDVWS